MTWFAYRIVLIKDTVTLLQNDTFVISKDKLRKDIESRWKISFRPQENLIQLNKHTQSHVETHIFKALMFQELGSLSFIMQQRVLINDVNMAHTH